MPVVKGPNASAGLFSQSLEKAFQREAADNRSAAAGFGEKRCHLCDVIEFCIDAGRSDGLGEVRDPAIYAGCQISPLTRREIQSPVAFKSVNPKQDIG